MTDQQYPQDNEAPAQPTEPHHEDFYLTEEARSAIPRYEALLAEALRADQAEARERALKDSTAELREVRRELNALRAEVNAAPAGNLVACPCTTYQQDESCPEGAPSSLCWACEGKGLAPIEKVIALAAEMMKIADSVGETEDPFAAWEAIDDNLHTAPACAGAKGLADRLLSEAENVEGWQDGDGNDMPFAEDLREAARILSAIYLAPDLIPRAEALAMVAAAYEAAARKCHDDAGRFDCPDRIRSISPTDATKALADQIAAAVAAEREACAKIAEGRSRETGLNIPVYIAEKIRARGEVKT